MALQGTLTRAGFSIDPKCCAGVKHLSGAARQAWWLWEEPQRGQIMGKTHTSLSDLVEPWARSGWDEGLRWNGHWLRSLDVPRGAPKAWCTQSPLSPSVPQAEQTGSSGTHTTQLLHSLKLTWHFPITGRQLNKLCLEEGGKKRKEFFSSENSCSYNHWLGFSSFLFFPFFFLTVLLHFIQIFCIAAQFVRAQGIVHFYCSGTDPIHQDLSLKHWQVLHWSGASRGCCNAYF